jgi:hypothetical protein
MCVIGSAILYLLLLSYGVSQRTSIQIACGSLLAMYFVMFIFWIGSFTYLYREGLMFNYFHLFIWRVLPVVCVILLMLGKFEESFAFFLFFLVSYPFRFKGDGVYNESLFLFLSF